MHPLLSSITPLDHAIISQQPATIGLPAATKQFLTLSEHLGLSEVGAALASLSLNLKQPKFLGGILCLLKQPEVIKLCRLWGREEFRFAEFARVGETVCHATELYKDLGGVDFAIPVSKLYWGDLQECYLSGLLACPPQDIHARIEEGRPPQLPPSWIQALRVWLLLTALEANAAGFSSEKHLKKFCTGLRVALSDLNAESKLKFFQHLSFSQIPETPSAFKALLQIKATEYLALSTADTVSKFDPDFTAMVRNDLPALFNRQFALAPNSNQKNYGTFNFTPATQIAKTVADQDHDAPDLEEPQASEEPSFRQRRVAGQDKVLSVQTNPDSTPEEQEQANSQVLLLSREDKLMLPWSWHRLAGHEKPTLFELISRLKTDDNFVAKLASAYATVAILTSESGRQVEAIEITNRPRDAWALHPQLLSLSRRPPRKQSGWTPKNLSPDQVDKWLTKTTEKWVIQLDARDAQAFFQATAKVSGARNLGELWKATGEIGNFADWVNSRLADIPELSRLTAPVLATIARQEAYVDGQDHLLSQVLSSNPYTALPAAAAYGAFSGHMVNKVFAPVLTPLATQLATAFLPLNWAGSQLEVLDLHLKTQLQGLQNRIDQAAQHQDDWVNYHNLLVTYVVLALLTVTGSRPVNSPFESAAWFDYQRKLLFIDDKSGGMARSSRLCILTDSVIDLVQQRYFPHLQNLADALQSRLPDFSAQIDAALAGNGDAKLPLFFYISNDPSFDWLEVTETGLAAQCGIGEWPIPFNFLRHRFSTSLRKLFLDVEIIEALMGHGDAGCETHGAFSLRIMSKDLAIARPLVQKITDALEFRVPHECQLTCRALNLQKDSNLFGYARRFGNKARALQRNSAQERAKQEALIDITKALDGRKPQSLSAEDWDQIGLQMVVHQSSRMPYAFGSLRYDVFQQYLRSIWKDYGVKPNIKRRFIVNRDATPTITEKSISALPLIANLREQFESACAELEKTSQRPMVACMLASLEACLNCNIADPTILIALACHSNISPVYFNGKAYIEHYTTKDWKDGQPVRRFPVSHRCLRHLLTGLSELKSRHKLANCPRSLATLPSILGLDEDVEFGKLLKSIAALVAEANCYNLNGLQAAVLDGRIHVSALPHQDWIRAVKLARFLTDDQRVDSQVPSDINDSLLTSAVAKAKTIHTESNTDTAKACHRLFSEIRKVITSDSSTKIKCNDIKSLLDANIFEEGDLVYALGEWAAYNLVRAANTKSGQLVSNSVVTYFNELAGRVASVGSAQQLSECDGDELLELYRSLLAPAASSPVSSSEIASIGHQIAHGTDDMSTGQDDPEAEVKKLDGSLIDQLLNFHEWAAKKYGLEDPDFLELGEFEYVAVGRPGYILKSEYLWCLRQLTSASTLRDVSDENLDAAMVAMLCYRFGLRSKEALGMHRSDWVDFASTLVVLVRHNRTRGLKNLQSKRQVPLLEPLTPMEKSIELEIIRRWEEKEGNDKNTHLLTGFSSSTFKHFCIAIRAKLLRLLKVATGNSRTTVHHLRHSFACRTLSSVAGSGFELGNDAASSATRSSSLRKLLLCHDRIDRRALWAVCRLLGHSSPATLLKCYFHGQVLPAPLVKELRALTPDELSDLHLVNLDRRKLVEDYLPTTAAQTTYSVEASQPQTLRQRMNYLRLRAIGFPVERAAFTTGTPISVAFHLEEFVSECARRLIPSHKGGKKLSSLADFVKKIAASRWQELLAIAGQSKGATIELKGTIDKAGPETIGVHRHLVLFREEHLHAFSEFCNDLPLQPSHVRLLRTEVMDEAMVKLHQTLDLERFSKGHEVNVKNSARISSATADYSSADTRKVRYLERWGAFAEPGELFLDNIELIALWICWASRAGADTAAMHSRGNPLPTEFRSTLATVFCPQCNEPP